VWTQRRARVRYRLGWTDVRTCTLSPTRRLLACGTHTVTGPRGDSTVIAPVGSTFSTEPMTTA